MFERALVDNASQLRNPTVPVELTLDDGSVLKGKFHISGTRPIFEVLNGNGLFLDFERHSGERGLIAKSTIRGIKLVKVPPHRKLAAAANPNDTFNPHKVLGINQDASFAQIREAYHRLSKIYHPDRYAGTTLPKEVIDYLNGVSRRINAAFAALNDAAQIQRTAPQAPTREEPIYTSKR